MSSEHFKRTSLHLVRLKIFDRWIKCLLEDIYIKFRETELVEIWQLNRVWIHGWLRMQECTQRWIWNLQLPTVQLSNNKYINGILGGTLDLGRDPFNQNFRKFRSNRKSFEKTGPPFEVVLFSRSDRSEFWLNGSRPWLDCNQRSDIWIFGRDIAWRCSASLCTDARAIFRPTCAFSTVTERTK